MKYLCEAALRSKMAYLDPDEIPFEKEFISSSEDTQVYIWKIDDIVYVTFRGTSSFKDVLEDLNIKRTRVSGKIKVHKGFYKQFQSVHIKITKTLLKLTENASRVIFSGHSLGGALAQIAAAYYGDILEDVFITCYTFGSPRVGNKYFVKWFSSRVDENVRVINENDPVPMVPTMFYWTHTDNICIKLKEKSVKYVEKDTPWYKRLFMVLFKSNLKRHSCDEYVLRMKLLEQ